MKHQISVRRLNRGALAAVLFAALAIAFGARGAQLPARQDVSDERLANGLRVVLAPHPTPADRVAMRLIIHAGSLDERDDQRGVAHFVQHMAFHGSSNFPGDSARQMFQSLGMELGKHENAYAAFDHTAYMLNLPISSDAAMKKGLAFLSDVLSGLAFPAEAVDTERSVILEEMRLADTPEQRVFEQVLPRLTSGSRLGERLPIGDEASIRRVKRDDCVAFHQAWYTPSNATLIISGDINVQEARALVKAQFGALESRPTPPRAGAGVKSFDQARAIVVTDPELSRAALTAIAIAPSPPPANTTERFREQLIDQLMRNLIDRRLEALSFTGEASFAGSGAYAGDAFGGLWIAQLVALGSADQWRAMFSDLIVEMERVRQYGFTDAELALVRNELLAEARAFAQSESTLPSDMFASVLAESIVNEAPLVSGRDNLALLEETLPTIAAADVSQRFAEVFHPDHIALTAELPDLAPLPTERELLAEAKRLARRPVQAPAEPVIVTSLMETRPAPTGLESAALDASTGVMTMRFASGVVVHHRTMEENSGRVFVRLTMAGGEIEETESTRGLTRAAMTFFDRPAFSAFNGLSMRDFLNSRGLKFGAWASLDAVTISTQAPVSELETVFQLLHLAMTDPVLEPAAARDWRERETSRAVRRLTQPRMMLEEALVDAIYPSDELRVRPLTTEQINRVTAESTQRWWCDFTARAPLELSIVGEVDRALVAELAARYLGSLPPRAAIQPGTLSDLRHVERAPAPHTKHVRLDTQSDQAVVAVGFIGPDAREVADVRTLDVVERIVRPQLVKKLRDELGLVYSLHVTNRPAQALPGFGLFLIVAPTSPTQASTVADLIERELSYFTEGGTGQYDVAIAQTQLAASATESVADPEHWSKKLADMTYRGRALSDIADEPILYRGVEPAQIREVMARRLTPETMIRVIVTPENEPN